LGIPREYFTEGLDPGVKKIINTAIDELRGLGAQVKEVSLPNTKYALSCYYIIMPVEVASNLSRYDGIKYGLSSSEANDLLDIYIKSRSAGFGQEAKRRIILGTHTSSAGYVDQYYNQAQKVRNLIKKDFDEVFKEVDFVLGPVTPTTAFKIGEKNNDPLTMYLSDIYTIAVNLAGLPAISVPVGLSDSPDGRLPVGLQIIGPQLSDLNIINLAKKIEEVSGATEPIL
jgi:aspartyl-tRNA(Asn)/glutamyl-tRNA(Gln) amidotransferase subunit A